MLKNTKKAEREQMFEEYQNGVKLDNGKAFELYMAKVYNASRHYTYAASWEAGDIVADGVHYQVKAYNGFWQGIATLEEFIDFILNVCKASRYLLKVGTSAQVLEGQEIWVDVNKQGLMTLARNGYIKFNRTAHGIPSAKWGMTKKQALHLYMNLGIRPIKG